MIGAYLVIITGCAFLVITSGIVISAILKSTVNKTLEEAAGTNLENEKGESQAKTNRLNIAEVIGKCENILIFTFLILEAYTAIALVVTAKTIVRKEEIEKNSMFFLGGTMINVAYSVIIGFIVKLVLLEMKFRITL